MALNETALEILANAPKREQNGIARKLVQGRPTIQSNVRHQFFSWWPDETFSGNAGKEFLFFGNTIYFPNMVSPYNGPWTSNRDAWLTFDETQVPDAVTFSGTNALLDTRVIFLQGGLNLRREYEKFRLYIPNSPIISSSANFFPAANIDKLRTTSFWLYFGYDFDLDISRYVTEQGAFSLTYEGLIGTTLRTESFQFRVPWGLNYAELHTQVSANVNNVTMTLRRNDLFGSDFVDDGIITVPPGAGSQDIAVSALNQTAAYEVEMTAGGGGETAAYSITFVWLPGCSCKGVVWP